MKNKLIKRSINTKWLPIIELHAQDLNLSWKEIAKKTGIHYNTLNYWTRLPEFKEACYRRYMELHGDKAMHVVEALYVEALEGNVRAAELYLKHTGKYTEKKVHEISPSELFMQSVNKEVNGSIDAVDAEVLQDPMLEVQNKVHGKVHESEENVHIEEPPKVHVRRKPKMTIVEEKKRVLNAPTRYMKDKKNKAKRNALMKLKRRAKKVGMPPMGFGKPSKTQRAEWLSKLEAMEKEQGIKVKHPSP